VDHLGLATVVVDGQIHTSTPPSNCCFDSTGKPVASVIDDAKRGCCPDEIQEVVFMIDDLGIVGHAWLKLPGREVGHYPNPQGSVPASDWIDGTVRPGKVFPDTSKPRRREVRYKACPESIAAINNAIDKHLSDEFALDNGAARNCAGWACGRLEDAGFTPPAAPNKKKLSPSDFEHLPQVGKVPVGSSRIEK
jgi:hypothetical protein